MRLYFLMILQPVAFEAIDGILLNKDVKAIIDEIEIPDDSNIIGKDINLINFRDYNLTLIGVSNASNLDEFIFNPANIDYVVRKRDILVVVGYKLTINQLKLDLVNLEFEV